MKNALRIVGFLLIFLIVLTSGKTDSSDYLMPFEVDNEVLSNINIQEPDSNSGQEEKLGYAPDEFIVKFKVTVQEDMATAIAANSVTISSLANLNKKYKVKSATPVFRKRLGKTTSEAVKSFQAMIENAQRARGATEGGKITDLSNIYVLKVEKGTDILEAVREYSLDPNVEYAEPDYIVRTVSTIPNDPFFSDLWGLQNTGQTGGTTDADIDTPEAWDIERGDSEIVVTVIDSGVDYTHEDLAANMWTNAGEIPDNGIDDDGNGYIDDYRGWDFLNNDNDPYDDFGHGTHCAGAIAAVGNNGIGVVGVNWGLKIMPLKFIGTDNEGYISDAIEAILYAIDKGANVMSNSWGWDGEKSSQAEKDAIQAADDAGILFIAAAMNNGSDNDLYPVYPASYDVPNIISVAATDKYDNLAGFSNYGVLSVDLGAPGVGILSTLPGNEYGYYSGTSMATPHVAGVAGLIIAYYPDATVAEVKGRILQNVDPLSTLSEKTLSGGRLNAYKALVGAYSPTPTIAQFTAEIKCGPLPLTVEFTNYSIYVSKPTWLWDFGDGETSTKENPSHTYSSGGPYTVSLTLTNDDGSDTLTKVDYIKVDYWCIDTPLNTSDASFIGENAGDGGGISVSFAGDVNGDGYDDIIIGAPGGTDAGQSYLVFGNATGWSDGKSLSLSNADVTFVGENAGDKSGYSISSAGDVNGDGYDDIIIGSPYNDEGGTDAGQIYLIFGRAKGWSKDMSLSDANASFIGENAYNYLGRDVSSAGDVNGDGYDDIIIGALDRPKFAGQIYLIFGRATGWSKDMSLSDANASFIGENEEDGSGDPISSAGDVNGDGYDDIIIGSTYNHEGGTNAGQSYLIFGRATGWFKDMSLSDADASFIGENAGDGIGYSISSAGDVNGDGYDDIIIGSPNNDEGGTNAGQSYLIFGRATSWSKDMSLSDANASFIGENARDKSGYSISSAGDVNGDGYDDIIIGAPGNNEGANFAGQSYLIFGRATGWSKNMSLSDADASFIGEKPYDYSGRSVSLAGDVNRDGYDDIIIGAPGNDEGANFAGQTYLILGGELNDRFHKKHGNGM